MFWLFWQVIGLCLGLLAIVAGWRAILWLWQRREGVAAIISIIVVLGIALFRP